MFKGLKKVVKGGLNVVSEHTTQLAEQVVGDPNTSKDHIKESLKKRVQGGVATVVDAGENVFNTGASSDAKEAKEKVGEVAHNIKHYGAFGEDYLGFSDPAKDLRKTVKQLEKGAKKARKNKKKKTGKKEDLFDPENLAKYKKELEEKKRRAEEAEAAESDVEAEQKDGDGEPKLELSLAAPTGDVSPDSSAAPTPLKGHTPARTPTTPAKENTDDWRLFQSLTSGVDNLIKKTQTELGEIKKDSYYQRKETKLVDKTREAEERRKLKKKKKWVDLDEDGFEDFDGDVEELEERRPYSGESEPEDKSEEEQVDPEVKETEAETQEEGEGEEKEKPKELVFKEPEDLIDPDEDDDLFNTDFVNAITSGEVKLAVIPDDLPPEEGDDPFDTAIADEVVKKQSEEKRKEETRIKFTGLSSVADVLAGKRDKVDQSAIEVTVRRKRRRANRINLIGEDGSEITKLEDIEHQGGEDKDEAKCATSPQEVVDILGGAEDSLPIPENNLLVSTPSPILVSSPSDQKSGKESSSGVDLSEFETLETSGEVKKELTSNVAILSGEFAQPVQEEEDDFDAAFDALAQESVTKSKLEELEKQFENDDIFDTSSADKVLKLASLLDKVEDLEEVEQTFEDPFDTSAYDHITGDVETELEFASLASREVPEGDATVPGTALPEEGGSSLFDSGPAVGSGEGNEGWANFAEAGSEESSGKKKPPRPAPPKPAPKRPPPCPAVQIGSDSSLRAEAPSVVVKAPSTESIKSWNCAVADNLIKKSKLDAEGEEALLEQEEEFDPFDTTKFGDSETITNFEDPFDTSAVKGIIGEASDEEREGNEDKEGNEVKTEQAVDEDEDSNEEEEVPDPFDILTSFDRSEVPVNPLAPESKDVTEADPFDTSFAADVLPNKGDPFDTSYVKGDPGKAEIKALEEEFLADIPTGASIKQNQFARARPKGGESGGNSADLSIKVPEPEEEEDDPFDTSIVDKVIPVRTAKKSTDLSVEDDDFDPTKAFVRSVSETKPAPEEIREEQEEGDKEVASLKPEEEVPQAPLSPGQLPKPPTKRASPKRIEKKIDSIDSDDFDPRA